MPKITDERRAERRQQILTAAFTCAAHEGFHRMTMADVIQASGLSAGAVYGYFRSKDELILALADTAISQIEPAFAALADQEPLPSIPEVVGLLTAGIEQAGSHEPDLTRVAVTAWAEAVRNPAVGAILSERFLRIRGHLVAYLERLQDAGRLDPEADPVAVAQATFGTIPGFVLQRLVIGDVSSGTYAAGWAALTGAPWPPGSSVEG
ncbi:hypothetical protein BJF86_13885 [Serinicoccus sp. CNJ-927]|uniref:TetR/AcrR family transcriptional regulator n=1 Tax=Serinicoccus sp. CNJ-927 TaxID=1904970 RepID=UPI000962C933|nr:TetR/AcrR family transcriptional regulator [Serinicoccus sp. CNJ-927]OLT43704.1 hypothetical protein BJF86_13885 [Serinicoccus sp. CNJ-927]